MKTGYEAHRRKYFSIKQRNGRKHVFNVFVTDFHRCKLIKSYKQESDAKARVKELVQEAMKKAFIALFMLLPLTSCTADYDGYEYRHEDYCTMLEFVECLHCLEIFGVDDPAGKTYDELMHIAAPVIMTDTFADTLGEGDCEQVYLLMFDYFKSMYPEAQVTGYLNEVITNELY